MNKVDINKNKLKIGDVVVLCDCPEAKEQEFEFFEVYADNVSTSHSVFIRGLTTNEGKYFNCCCLKKVDKKYSRVEDALSYVSTGLPNTAKSKLETFLFILYVVVLCILMVVGVVWSIGSLLMLFPSFVMFAFFGALELEPSTSLLDLVPVWYWKVTIGLFIGFFLFLVLPFFIAERKKKKMIKANSMILGSSGGGKMRYFGEVKEELITKNKEKIIIIDPEDYEQNEVLKGKGKL